MSKNNEIRDAHSYFLETFPLLHTNKPKFNYRMSHPELSQVEKKLLKAWLEFHRNHKEKSLSLLLGSPIQDPLLEGVRLYLIGLVYNQHGHFRYAVENLEKSTALFYSLDHPFILNPMSVLAIVSANRKDPERLEYWMGEIRKLKPSNTLSELQILYCEVVHAFMTEDHSKVFQLIEKIESRSFPEYKSFAPHLLVIHLSVLNREKKYKQSYEMLEKYKKISENAVVRANYSFIKAMLDHLYLEKPIYIYAPRYKEFPELHQQLEVIKNLSTGNLASAEKFWIKLQLHNPEIYRDGYRYEGDGSLFSQALEKYQGYSEALDWNREEINSISSKIERLGYILDRAISPISQDLLVGLIWNEESDQKNLARLRKLVSIFSKDRNIKVVCAQNAYHIKKDKRTEA